MKRAVDIGPLDAAAIKTAGGKVRLRLLFTVEQLEALLAAARAEDDGDGSDPPAGKRNVTQCNAPESDERREIHRGGDARATPDDRVFVIEGTRAWRAWIAHKRRETGREWTLTVSRIVDRKSRTGWWFPSLFPPSASEAADSTQPDPLMSPDDARALAEDWNK